jgi:hypothetical protein
MVIRYSAHRVLLLDKSRSTCFSLQIINQIKSNQRPQSLSQYATPSLPIIEPMDLRLSPHRSLLIEFVVLRRAAPYPSTSGFEATESRQRRCGLCNLPGHDLRSQICMVRLRQDSIELGLDSNSSTNQESQSTLDWNFSNRNSLNSRILDLYGLGDLR